MSFPCHFCSVKLYPSKDGSKKFYEDESQTVVHVCPKLNQKKDYSKLDEHRLLTSTITRVSKLEQVVDDLKKKFDSNFSKGNNQ